MISVLTNSNDSPRSSFGEILAVAIFLLIVVAAAAWYFYSAGYLLYYGDAQAHLNISRSLIDSRTPGYDQLGTVWLPVLHVLCLPFAAKDFLWESGLAGTFPVAACFVAAGVGLYLCGKEAYGNWTAALAVVLCFALNPNVFYLATIPMTEIVFVAGLAWCLLSLLWFRKTQKLRWICCAIIGSWWMSLTRYDGWFLIPFIAFFLMSAAKQRKSAVLISAAALASLAPIYWLAHNWWETANALDFYNGPYSAAAIQGDRSYPGFHDWPQAIHYYWEAGRVASGNGLLVLGLVGLLVAMWRRKPGTQAKTPAPQALLFLMLTPVFYVWSVHSSKTPIHLPSLWPYGYYNSRYGIAVVVLMSFAVGSLVSVLSPKVRLLIPLVAIAPWFVRASPDNWICWKESQVNSVSRRAWTAQAADYLGSHYRSGDGILTEFGDLAGIFGKSGLHLSEAIHEGSGPAWFANTMPNGLVNQAKWAMAQQGDKLAHTLDEAKSFQVVDVITVEGAPNLLIYERN